MIEITIKAITDAGDAALQKHLTEYRKMSIRQKLIFKALGYRQTITNLKPCVLVLTVGNNPKFAAPILDRVNNIKVEIEKALLENGAKYGEDYTITEED